jgi:methylmalonyl-CoA/ethylmalonyl-CoA epimerase
MKLHHTGFIVQNREKYLAHLIYQERIKEVYDPVQDAYLTLLSNFSDSFIELIQPVSEKSQTYNFLKKNGEGFHHFCYEIADQKQLDDIEASYKLIKVFGPVPAILFDNKQVVFYFNRNRQIVEFLL